MVAYFRKQNNLFMLLPVMFGVVIGRIAAGFWANRKLRSIQDLLYVQVKPIDFLAVFKPIVERTPRNTIAYVDGCVKLAFAYEALGCFEEAMACIAPLGPEKLKNHTLGGMAITCNQRMRLLLLQRDTEQAAACLESLRTIADTAMERAPALGRSTRECVRLYENWLSILSGQPADEDYLVEEVHLSKNRIHKSEIELLLAQFEIWESQNGKESIYWMHRSQVTVSMRNARQESDFIFALWDDGLCILTTLYSSSLGLFERY